MKRQYKHRDKFVYVWQRLPASIAKEYEQGKSALELGYKYHTTPNSILKRLRAMGVTIRPRASNLHGFLRQKLYPKDIEIILQEDAKNVSHSDLAREFNVSRERIRQICLQSGHATRSERMTKALESKEAVIARRIEHKKDVELISEGWKRGIPLKAISILIWGYERPAPKISTRISALRKRWGPEMFPWRREHWEKTYAKKQRRRINKN